MEWAGGKREERELSMMKRNQEGGRVAHEEGRVGLHDPIGLSLVFP